MVALLLRTFKLVVPCVLIAAAVNAQDLQAQDQRAGQVVRETPSFSQRLESMFSGGSPQRNSDERTSEGRPINGRVTTQQSQSQKQPNAQQQTPSQSQLSQQQQSQRARPSPTGRANGNMFGKATNATGDRSMQPARPQTQWQTDKKAAPTRPSQVATPAVRRPPGSVELERDRGGDLSPPVVSRGPRFPADMRNVSPDQIEPEAVPTLARRVPSARTESPNTPLEEPQVALPPPRSLKDRLAAVQQGGTDAAAGIDSNDEPAMASPGDLKSGSSRRAASFADNGASRTTNSSATAGINASQARQTVSPESTDRAFESEEPEVASIVRSAASDSAAASNSASTDKATEARTSSRRGFSNDASADRVATSTASERMTGAGKTGAGASSPDVIITRQSPMLSVETAGPRTIVIGKEAAYNVVIRNSGDVAAQDVSVTIRIPEWAEVVGSKPTVGNAQMPAAIASEPGANSGASTAGVASSSQTLQWNLPRLEARGKEQLALKIIPRKSRPFDLSVQWTFMPISSQAHVEVQEPKLVMNLSGPEEVLYGQTKIYKLTLANPGNGDAENVTIHLSPIGDQAAAVTKHPIGTIRAGDSKVIEVELTAKQAGKVVIKAMATADGGIETDVAEDVLVRRAALAVTVDGAKNKYAGTTTGYQINVANPGNAPAESVQISAHLPAGAKYVSSSNSGQLSSDGTKVIWSIPSLKASTDVELELKCVVNTAGSNKLQVATTAAGDLASSGDAVTAVEALADLKLEVIDPKGPTAVGEDIIYEVRVKNRGTKAAAGVNVAGYFSEGVEPISATGAAHEVRKGEVMFKPLASLAPGSETILKIKARADRNGSHIFLAKVICESVGSELVSQVTTLFYGEDVAKSDAVQIEAVKTDAAILSTTPSAGSSNSETPAAAGPAAVNATLDNGRAANAPAVVPAYSAAADSKTTLSPNAVEPKPMPFEAVPGSAYAQPKPMGNTAAAKVDTADTQPINVKPAYK